MALGTIIDSNVVLDVLTEDEEWLAWSTDALGTAAESGPLFINPIIYGEVSVRFTTILYRTYFPTVRVTAPS